MDPEKKSACPCCGPLAGQLATAKSDPHHQYLPILQQLMELERQGILELFAGDCPLERAPKLLEEERHYTLCHYLRCRRCGAVYFVGACIRGTPVYRRVTNLQQEHLDTRLWGRYGEYFRQS